MSRFRKLKAKLRGGSAQDSRRANLRRRKADCCNFSSSRRKLDGGYVHQVAQNHQFYSDAKTAAVQRKKVYANATKEHYLFAVAHVSFPGIGRVRTDGAGYAWMPVNYMVTK